MKDTQKCFVCGQDKFTHCILFPLWQYLHLRDSLPLLLKTFEWFCFVKFFSNTVYKGEVLLKSRWVILGLRLGPQKSFFQKTTHKGNDSRNLEYNPEVGREVYFFTWAIFIKKITFYLCTSKASADVCFILCWRGFYWFLWTLWHCRFYIPQFLSP